MLSAQRALADQTISRQRGLWLGLAAFLAIGLIPPFLLSPSWLRVGSLFFLSMVLLSGLHVTTGLTRIVSLCHAALAGVGAYTGAALSLRLGFPPLVSIAAGTVLAAVVAWILAVATRRLEDHYLTLATLAASEILGNVFRSAATLTGGANGLSGVPSLSVAGVVLASPAAYYPFCATMGAAALVGVLLLDRAPIGRALRAMGDEGELVESLGVSASTLRGLGFVGGGALAGLAGAVGAHLDGFVGPESFGVSLSIGYLCFLAVGGLRRGRSIVIGAALSTLGLEFFRTFREWQMIIVAVIVLVLLYAQRDVLK